MEFFGSQDLLVMFMPIVVYWVYSGMYELLGSMDKYRLHSRREEETKNLASKKEVVKGVLFQQAIQATISFIFLKISGNSNEATTSLDASFMVVARQFFIAMLVMDTWQYFVHRYMHFNKFLYRKVHSWHHRIVAPYAFAAQYNHPIDGVLVETLGGAAAFFLSGMSPQTSIFFFSFATIKGIDDHCGLMIPWNPLHILFTNNAGYHDTHHQLGGAKYNFSQPFFVMWDKILGSYAPYTIEKRMDGGYEARIRKEI
ncbi:sphinganine C4-monooxygenase 2-like [Typha angustifolia]|uniref:sphinganine C4-monooxygenase 2-like n=1 Tax=Typha angustifolia TaxID=59011 RepID=UPI003C2ABE10